MSLRRNKRLLLRYEKSHNKGIVQNVENKNKFF